MPAIDSVRVNKYTSYYKGPVSGKSTAGLKVKSMSDRAALQYMLSPPSIYHVTNITSRGPRPYDLRHHRHPKPLHIVPEHRGGTRYVRGMGDYRQRVLRQIQELSQLVI